MIIGSSENLCSAGGKLCTHSIDEGKLNGVKFFRFEDNLSQIIKIK